MTVIIIIIISENPSATDNSGDLSTGALFITDGQTVNELITESKNR